MPRESVASTEGWQMLKPRAKKVQVGGFSLPLRQNPSGTIGEGGGKGCFPTSGCRLGQAAARLPAEQLSLHRGKLRLNSPMGSVHQGALPRSQGWEEAKALHLPCYADRSVFFLTC